MSKLLINENPLMVLPTLAVKIGLNEAILLQQVHYWIDPRINKNYINGKFWVYNTLDKWLSQFPFWSKSTLRRTIKNLENNNLLLSTNRVIKGFDQTKWYSINYDQLERLNLSSYSYAHSEHIDISKLNTSDIQSEQMDLSRLNNSKMHIEHYQLPKVSKTYNRDTKNTTENTSNTNHKEKLSEFLEIYENILNPNSNYQSIVLDKKRTELFLKILRNFFDLDKFKWKTFLDEVSKSDFLMGKVTSFRVHFDWLLKEENIQKILEGAYSSKNNRLSRENEEESIKNKAAQFLDSLSGIEGEVYHTVSNFIGLGAFVSWFKKTRPHVDSENNSFCVECDNKFVMDWIQTNYDNKLKQAIEKLGLAECKISYSHRKGD